MAYKKNTLSDDKGPAPHCKSCTCGAHGLDSIRKKSLFKAEAGYSLQELFEDSTDMLPMQAALAYGVARRLGLREAADDIAHGFMEQYGRQLTGYATNSNNYGQLEEAVSAQPTTRVSRIARPSLPAPETQNFQYN